MPLLHDLVLATPRIGARPDSLAALADVIENPSVSAHSLLPVIERDPALTAGLLKLCNSSFYSLSRQVGTPREALVMVGNLAFARVCFTLSLESSLQQNLAGYGLEPGRLWRHSLATAYGASILVKGMGYPDLSGRAFTVGLLHDVGKVVLDGPLAAAGGVQGSSNDMLVQEQAITGFDHAEAGAALLEHWHLPSSMVDAVRYHHDPQAAGEAWMLAQAVDVASRVEHVADRVRSGMRVVEDWVARTFDGVSIATRSIESLMETLAQEGEGIVALALNPRL